MRAPFCLLIGQNGAKAKLKNASRNPATRLFVPAREIEKRWTPLASHVIRSYHQFGQWFGAPEQTGLARRTRQMGRKVLPLREQPAVSSAVWIDTRARSRRVTAIHQRMSSVISYLSSPNTLLCVRAVLAAICIAGPIASAAEPPLPERLFPQLEPILSTALKQAPGMINAALDREQQDGYARVSSARLYPQVNGSFRYAYQREDRLDLAAASDTEKMYYNFGANQALYHWGTVRAEALRGRIQAAIAANNTRETYRLLALQIRAEFLQLVITKASLRNAELDLDARRRKLAILRSQLDAGQTTAGAVGGADLAIQQGELARDRAAHTLAQQLRRFRRLVGDTGFSADSLPLEIPSVVTLPTDQADVFRANFVEKESAEDRVRLANLRLEKQREELSGLIQKMELRPKFNLVAGAYQDEISYTVNIGQKYRVNAYFVGVELNWNIFDGFAARGRRQASLARQRQLERQAETVRDELEEEAVNASADLGFAARALKFSESGLAGAQSVAEDMKKRLGDGRASEDLLLDAEIGLRGAQVTTFGARAEYLRALASYLSVVEADPIVNALAEPVRKR
jgi:outer membrane protein TolC